ncbi:MAG: arsenosugar biosynthesis radical SAM (seleno)protein ArsS [Aeoliella sp.]
MSLSTATADPLPIIGQSFAGRLGEPLRAASSISKLQINLGLVCNLACRHCHVESSPTKTAAIDNMDEASADRVLDWIEQHPTITTVDLTGGSPEMNPHFRRFVSRCREMGRHVMDRCNPTILVYENPKDGTKYDWIAEFLAEQEVEVVASLPCYLEDNVRYQRGKGAYDASIDGLRQLNAVGYGTNSRLKLDLVYNPNGPYLPPPQVELADDYHRELDERFGIVFNELWTITNMPIKRWRADLARKGQLEDYMQLLATAYNPATVDGLMCRHQIHIDSQGRLYDCDFNYALGLAAPVSDEYLWDVSLGEIESRTVVTGDHCYGCTAGSGSSCGGELI